MEAFRRALEDTLDGEVRFDRVSRGVYSTDAGPYQVFPVGVVIPRGRDDVIATLRICRDHSVPITARGGGTSQGGQAVGPGIQLDFSKYMNQVLDLDRKAATVRVEPGIVVAELNAQLAAHGLELPLDLSTANRATIGGMIANNSAGTRSVVYGTTVDYISELEVLLADGSIVTLGNVDIETLADKCTQDDHEGRCYRTIRDITARHADRIRQRFPKILRRNGGYRLDAFVDHDGNGPPAAPLSPVREDADTTSFNLAHLLAGSEGTLGLVLSATMKLVAPPKSRVLGVAQFADVRRALVAVPAILEHGPSAIELMDRKLLDMTAGKPEYEPLRDFIAGDPGAVLIVELMAETPDPLPDQLDALEACLADFALTAPLHRAIEPAAQARIWKLRQAGLGLSMSETGDTKGLSFIEDTAVAPERLPEYIDRFQEVLTRNDADAVFYAHASVGLLHIRPSIDMKTAAGVGRFERIADEVAELVLEYGGALSGEHGDGMVRSPFQERMFGPELYAAFCEIKQTFDPQGLLNPGKVVHAPPLTDNLRYGTAYTTNDIDTVFDFSDFGGISRAAEQCGGVGACRKTLTGTMCPSYLATRDEVDNTRGRATALRLAISGQLDFSGLTDPALHPVLDLCLECKACKTECPTGVDMARMKSEFLHQCAEVRGHSARARVLAGIARTAELGSRAAPFANLLSRNPMSAWLLDKTLGIDRRRSLPPFARETFRDWCMENRTPPPAPDIAIFADTFTNHFEPNQGRAAVRVAERLGHTVTVPPRVCCGRPLISKGFLHEARQQAEATVQALLPLAQAGTPIVFCEPGCFSAVRDDHPKLVSERLREAAEQVARSSFTFEEWAAPAIGRSDLQLGGAGDSGEPPQRVLVHAHCHQKALVGTGSSIELMEAIPGCEVVDADAACCGMAGSFGYEREHYEISRQVGEHRLFPAVRDAGKLTTVVASGFSCRQQIRHFTGAWPVSAIELLDRLMTPGRSGNG